MYFHNQVKFKKRMRNTLIFSLLVFAFLSCESTSISIVVNNSNNGEIFIDSLPLESFIISKYSDSPGDTLYYLRLKNGIHKLKIITNSSVQIDTTFNVKGEAYLGVDLETGEFQK